MPLPQLMTYADKAGVSLEKAEDAWKKAKKITAEDHGVPESEFTDKEWSYTMGVTKNMLGIKESLYTEFLDSKLNAKKFIESKIKNEDAQVSTSLGHLSDSPNPIIPSKELEVAEAVDGNVNPTVDVPYRKFDNEGKIESGDQGNDSRGSQINLTKEIYGTQIVEDNTPPIKSTDVQDIVKEEMPGNLY